MVETLSTRAEVAAEKAESLAAFSGLKLLHIRRTIATLLGLIGRDGIFDEYTVHDISHIQAMLEILDWLIPPSSVKIMSPTDWLMVVLAIYFHDLGMLVTRREYENRNSSGFPEFCEKTLFSEESGVDYRAKVSELPSDRVDRFLYQEFVRFKHAERVRAWITGEAKSYLGVSHEAVDEVERLLAPLDVQFRRDLALVCESHHLDDLYDFKKYKISQPYGNSEEETGNILYAAILLRTADLLHITSDRTPSVAFRVLNPTDPISQQEWAKQAAVKRVRSKIASDKDGTPNPGLPRDSIEVHAFFRDEKGFFGLTSYLTYAEAQLRKSFEWMQAAARNHASRHEFPWRHIDDSNIETDGFLKDTFEFTIDQARILDLLTGHTLYNDTRVVLRELVQNAIDAVRLQRVIHQEEDPSTAYTGRVRIGWDGRRRVLSVEDNGTGMSQDIIERHLLKVGASRYQDSEFRKKFPDFSAISRFGIGILSCFMIADSVEIITCHPEDDRARELSLRSVHGKYLIRTVDKRTGGLRPELVPHGTRIRLTVRPSAKMPDVLETAKKWVVMPACEVVVKIDTGAEVQIGFSSPKEALIDYLHSRGKRVENETPEDPFGRIRIEERTRDGVAVAYALRWNEFLQEWSFLRLGEPFHRVEDQERFPLGTCIEGIRIDSHSPGFIGRPIIALANTFGPHAPKTNVARTGIESTPEQASMLRSVYRIYCDHVKSEMEDLQAKRAFSLTWATQESRFLLEPLVARGQAGSILDRELFYEVARHTPMFVMELGGERKSVSPAFLAAQPYFWTIDCQFFHSAEYLIKEVPGQASLAGLAQALHAVEIPLPKGPLVCGSLALRAQHESIQGLAFQGKEVDEIVCYRAQRRVDLRWSEKRGIGIWRSMRPDADQLREVRRFGRAEASELPLFVARSTLEVPGLTDEIAVRAFDITFMLSNSPAAAYLNSCLDKVEADPTSEAVQVQTAVAGAVFAELTSGSFRPRDWSQKEFVSFIDERLERISLPTQLVGIDVEGFLDIPPLHEATQKTNWKIFDPSAWYRKPEV